MFFSEYPKFLFWISEISISISEIKRLFLIILDIWNNYSGYQKHLFQISRITILDIWKNWINVNFVCHRRKSLGQWLADELQFIITSPNRHCYPREASIARNIVNDVGVVAAATEKPAAVDTGDEAVIRQWLVEQS